MSLQETICPTRERLSKGDRIEAPEFTQTTKREAYRAQHKFEEWFHDGKINGGCLQAGMRLIRHIEGSLGHDVRLTIMDGLGVDSDPHGFRQPPTTHHAQKLADARKYMLQHNTKTAWATWQALTDMAEGKATPEAIGFRFGESNAPQARAVGRRIVAGALEALSVHWGFSQAFHQHPPSR